MLQTYAPWSQVMTFLCEQCDTVTYFLSILFLHQSEPLFTQFSLKRRFRTKRTGYLLINLCPVFAFIQDRTLGGSESICRPADRVVFSSKFVFGIRLLYSVDEKMNCVAINYSKF